MSCARPVPDFLSFFPYGVFLGQVFSGHHGTLTCSFSLITFAVAMYIFWLSLNKVGYGVTPRPYPIFSRICCLFSFY